MNKVIKVIVKDLLVNVFLVVIKILSGLIFNSTALLADGVNSLSDLITDFISFFGEEIAKLKKGKKKIIFEDKTSFVIGIIVIILAIGMIIMSFKTDKSVPSAIVIYITIFVIIVKFAIVKYVSKMGKKLDNSILISRAEESKADIVSSIIALIAILLSQLSKYIEILKYADIIGGLVIGVITLYAGIDIIIKNEKNIKRIEENHKNIGGSI